MSELETFLDDCEYIYRNGEPETVRIATTFINGVKMRVEKRVNESYLLQADPAPLRRSYGQH